MSGMKCEVCAEPSKYKCPKCKAPYCSVACCGVHKSKCQVASASTAAAPSTSPPPPPAAAASQTSSSSSSAVSVAATAVQKPALHAVLQPHELEALRQHPWIHEQLRSKRLCAQIVAVDEAADRQGALKRARAHEAEMDAFCVRLCEVVREARGSRGATLTGAALDAAAAAALGEGQKMKVGAEPEEEVGEDEEGEGAEEGEEEEGGMEEGGMGEVEEGQETANGDEEG